MTPVIPRAGRLAALLAAVSLVLAACGLGEAEPEESPAGAGDCAMMMAVNPWVGYQASAYVVGEVAENQLGCTVTYKNMKETEAWRKLGAGEVDVIIEDWGHPKLERQFFKGKGDGSARDFGPNGNIGVAGWYVPPWLADAHPEVTSWKKLNNFAGDFATPKTGKKGRFLAADPTLVQFDQALMRNLDLDFTVRYSGSIDASIAAFRKAEEEQEYLIGYFFQPHWFHSEVELQRVSLPKPTKGCHKIPSKVDCGYPEQKLKKIVSTSWAKSGNASVTLVKKFEWTNEDQNDVAKLMALEGMSPDDAAATWIEQNPDKVEGWLG